LTIPAGSTPRAAAASASDETRPWRVRLKVMPLASRARSARISPSSIRPDYGPEPGRARALQVVVLGARAHHDLGGSGLEGAAPQRPPPRAELVEARVLEDLDAHDVWSHAVVRDHRVTLDRRTHHDELGPGLQTRREAVPAFARLDRALPEHELAAREERRAVEKPPRGVARALRLRELVREVEQVTG